MNPTTPDPIDPNQQQSSGAQNNPKGKWFTLPTSSINYGNISQGGYNILGGNIISGNGGTGASGNSGNLAMNYVKDSHEAGVCQTSYDQGYEDGMRAAVEGK